MLTLYRRHKKACIKMYPTNKRIFRPNTKSTLAADCTCPIQAEGTLKIERRITNRSTFMNTWDEAEGIARQWEAWGQTTDPSLPTSPGALSQLPPIHVAAAPAQVPLRSATTPLLVSDLFTQQCVLEINEGRLLTFKQIAEKMQMTTNGVRLIFKTEPGVVKMNSEYRVPQCVFDRVILRTMKK
jgi:hypothetical protein